MLRALIQSNTLAARRHFSAATKPLFDKILVANRGEIACRVMQTAKKMGIKCVAVHSTADSTSKFVRMADEAYCIGPPASKDSYLNMDAVCDAVMKSGAQAVHPGYGFLSENTVFAKRLEDMGCVFIGPDAYAINAMGDKINSKLLAIKAGVNCIPGVEAVIETVDEAVQISRQIGYPVMIKASAGGGGKGMRIAYNDDEARSGFQVSKNEAMNSFKDDRVFIEKFIEEPRHIEIQVLADAHGNAVYLNERECSIQRRNQKVFEEAPSPFLDEATRSAMGQQAVALAKAVKYRSAGTVEMLVDKHKNFYFLEMNTRLQVEHPVTEYITGLDLVEQMIRVAAGQKLAFTQEQVQRKGWALECRVYAEDARRDFLPSIGTLKRYQEPDVSSGEVRCDSGITEGSQISIYYDPLISKLVTYGKDRSAAIDRMKEALDSYVIRGVTHNVDFLRTIMENKKFLSGDLSTAFIGQQFPDGFKGHTLTALQSTQLLAAAAALRALDQQRAATISGRLVGAGAAAHAYDRDVLLSIDKSSAAVAVAIESNEKPSKVTKHMAAGVASRFTVTANGASHSVIAALPGSSTIYRCNVDGSDVVLQLLSTDALGYTLQFCGSAFRVQVMNTAQHKLQAYMPAKKVADTSKSLVTPMPGLVANLLVKVGDKVAPGQPLAVIEAMKMQNMLSVAKAFVVKAIHVKVGENVALDDTLITFEDIKSA